MQLRELASLNGTLRDDEALICNNCGATGHRKYECPEMKNFTINLVCKICNGAGHTARGIFFITHHLIWFFFHSLASSLHPIRLYAAK